MFKDIKKCLDDYEETYIKNKSDRYYILPEEELDKLLYFELHLAEELIKNKYCDSEKLAKIIIANQCR